MVKTRLFIISAFILIVVLGCKPNSGSNATFELQVSVTPLNAGAVSPDSGFFDEGEVVLLEATPNESWHFAGFQGDFSSLESSAQLNMDSDKNIEAVFINQENPILLLSNLSVGRSVITLDDESMVHTGGGIFISKYDPLGNLLWRKDYSGSSSDNATRVKSTEDGGFIVVGTTNSTDGDFTRPNVSPNSEIDIVVMKLNEEGEKEWFRFFGGANFDRAYDVIQTSDGGYLISGSSDSRDGSFTGTRTDAESLLIKLSGDGATEWIRKYGGGTQREEILRVFEMENGDYMAFRWSFGEDDPGSDFEEGNLGSHDVVMFRISSTGEVLWYKKIGGSDGDNLSTVIRDSNGDFLLAGYTASADVAFSSSPANRGDWDAFVLKVSDQGEVIWAITFGGSRLDAAIDITQQSNGDYVVVGMSRSDDVDFETNYGRFDAFVTKIRNNGTLDSIISFGGSDNENVFTIIESGTDQVFITGSTSSDDYFFESNQDNSGVFLLKKYIGD